MDNKSKKLEKNVSDLKEWHNNQYNPGYWTGGRMPFFYRLELKKFKTFFILIGVLGIIFFVYTQLQSGFNFIFLIPELILLLTIWATLKA
jgi:hypothetical protein